MTTRVTIALLVFAAAAGCTAPTQRVRGANRPGYVRRVPLQEVARLLVQHRGGSVWLGAPPLVLAVSPLAVPSRPWLLACTWKDGRLGNLAFVDARTHRPLTWRDEDVNWRPDDVDRTRIEQLMHFDAELSARPISLKEAAPLDTYYVAPLCEDGPRAAILLTSKTGTLYGWAAFVVLERAPDGWRFVHAWIAWEA